MKIRLLARDSKMPNIPLMKISTYYKRRGHDVDWYNPVFDIEDTDRLYESILYSFTSPYHYYPRNARITKGGTGYSYLTELRKAIDEIKLLDYSLYPECEYSVQFYSRGCDNRCPFCCVPLKEGNIRSVHPMTLNPNGKWIEVLDNSFFDNPHWRYAVMNIGDTPVKLNGVRLQTLDEEKVEALNELKLANNSRIHIAWDFAKEDLRPKLEWLISRISRHKIVCYVLVGYNSTMAEDLYRLNILKELGISPFVMPYNKRDRYQSRLARWANVRQIFKSIDFEDFRERNEYNGEYAIADERQLKFDLGGEA